MASWAAVATELVDSERIVAEGHHLPALRDRLIYVMGMQPTRLPAIVNPPRRRSGALHFSILQARPLTDNVCPKLCTGAEFLSAKVTSQSHEFGGGVLLFIGCRL
jgi:hypothetical protein